VAPFLLSKRQRTGVADIAAGAAPAVFSGNPIPTTRETMDSAQIENIEIDLLADAVFRRYGFDFRNYARASLTRRVKKFCDKTGRKHPSQLIPLLIHDRVLFDDFVLEVSVTVTELFRDPPVYRAIRRHVLPFLATFPHARIWHAGCATGE